MRMSVELTNWQSALRFGADSLSLTAPRSANAPGLNPHDSIATDRRSRRRRTGPSGALVEGVAPALRRASDGGGARLLGVGPLGGGDGRRDRHPLRLRLDAEGADRRGAVRLSTGRAGAGPGGGPGSGDRGGVDPAGGGGRVVVGGDRRRRLHGGDPRPAADRPDAERRPGPRRVAAGRRVAGDEGGAGDGPAAAVRRLRLVARLVRPGDHHLRDRGDRLLAAAATTARPGSSSGSAW